MNDLYPIVQKFHAGWAYVVLVLLLVAVFTAVIGVSSKKEFTPGSRRAALLGLIGVHIQLLVGLVLYFVSPLGKDALPNMKDAAFRLTALEHPAINIVAIILITVGWSAHKRKPDSQQKFKTIAIFYTIGTILILSRIPWDLWFK